MTIHLHRATRTDRLADALAGVLAEPLGDPFAEEVVVVPAKGVERWLTQRLSHHLGAGSAGDDGVCAGVRFLNPRSLVALLTGTEHDDPWDPDRFVWPLLDVVDASLDEAWCRPLARHLGHGVEGEQGELRRERRYSVVRRLAGLFAAYATQRPWLLTDWREGRETDGLGRSLPADLAWQPELWRRLTARVAAPAPDLRLDSAVAAIRSGEPLALPHRLSMFGHTRLSRSELDVLDAVGRVREVHLWLPQPSPALWDRLAATCGAGPVRRRDDDSADAVRHRLLASLGRDSRELQRSLAVLGDVHDCPGDADDAGPDDAGPDGAGPDAGPEAGRGTLLARLQGDLRRDRQGDPLPMAADDHSVQVHSCHGPARQVGVLRDVLVGILEDDPTLEPRDVLVMCPDVEAFAPLFSAAFGLAEVAGDHVAGPEHPGHRLRLRLADRGPARINPLLELAGRLVAIAGGRATVSEVADLAGSDPVRRRFAWSDDELAEVLGWVRRSGIRWGLSPELRAAYGLDALEENTWRTGLDRVLLGVAAAEDGPVLGGRLPLDDVGSARVELAGALSELVDRLEAAVLAMRAARTLEEWVAALRSGVGSLGAVARRDAWQQAQFDRELELLTEQAAAAGGGFGGELRLADVRTLLELRLAPRPTRANFRTGHLTVATLVPMRSVPHRVVCLVGLDDGVYPRSTVTDGDDVLARDPLTGERDPRSEDRQLLLDAVLATEETLVVTFTGASIQNNQERPPAVPVDELLDALEAIAPGARSAVVRQHPLQPFDPRTFEPGGRLFSFDADAGAAARTLQATRERPRAFLADPLPEPDRDDRDVLLEELQSFLRQPVAGFLRQGLDVGLPADHAETQDGIPLQLDGLEQWQVGDRILQRLLGSDTDGEEAQRVLTAEMLRGELPPRRLGERLLHQLCTRVQALATASQADRTAGPTVLDVAADLGDGRRLTGAVPDVRGSRIVRVHYSSLSAKHRLASWVDLVALSAAYPDTSWTAATYGWFRRYGKEGVAWSLLGPVEDPSRLLGELVDLRDRGLREPLPLFLKTSAAWAKAGGGDGGQRAATWAWRGSDRVPGEDADPAHVRVYGPGTDLLGLLGHPRDDERWSDREPTRIGQYAARLWAPLLAAETGRNL